LSDLKKFGSVAAKKICKQNDLFFSYNIQFRYEYYAIEHKKYSVCFQCCRFALPSCKFIANFSKVCSVLTVSNLYSEIRSYVFAP